MELIKRYEKNFLLEDTMDDNISLMGIIAVLKKRLILIVSVTFVSTFICLLVNYYYLTPAYQASTQLLVSHTNSEEPRYEYSEIQTSLELINTYSVIIKSPIILEKVREDLNLDESVEALNSMISVTSENESQVVRITVVNTDFEKATEIANKTGEVFQEEVINIMNIDNVSVLSEAELRNNPVPIHPNRTLNIAIGFIVGLMVSIGLSFFLEYFDHTIKNEKEIKILLNTPVLGSVSNLPKKIAAEDNIKKTTVNAEKGTFES